MSFRTNTLTRLSSTAFTVTTPAGNSVPFARAFHHRFRLYRGLPRRSAPPFCAARIFRMPTSDHFELNSEITTRDRDSVQKTFSGLMKDHFPPTAFALSRRLRKCSCFALEGRKRVKEQILRIDETFAPVTFSYTDRATGETKTNLDPRGATISDLSPQRKWPSSRPTEESILDIADESSEEGAETPRTTTGPHGCPRKQQGLQLPTPLLPTTFAVPVKYRAWTPTSAPSGKSETSWNSCNWSTS